MSPIHFFKCLPLPKCCFFFPYRHFPRLTCKINGADCKWKPPSGVSGVWCRSSFSRRRRRRHLHFWETSARLHFMCRDAPTSGCAALLLSAGFQTHYGDAHHADTRREIKKKKNTPSLLQWSQQVHVKTGRRLRGTSISRSVGVIDVEKSEWKK